MKKNRYEIIVFFCGAMSMALELVAARIFSPYVGSSNLVWTTIIGMILIFMSLGYSVGGKKADKDPDIKILKMLLMISIIYVAILPFLEEMILKPFAGLKLPLVVTAIIMSVLLFGFPSFTFAFASPLSVKLKQIEEKEKDNVGEISGRMSSWSTIGSILGTFLTGFLLIPVIGTSGIMILILVVLTLLVLFLEESFTLKKSLAYLLFVVSVAAVFMTGRYLMKIDNPEILKDVDSEYSRIQIKEMNTIYGETLKYMQVGNVGAESLRFTESGKISDYLYYYDLLEYYLEENSGNILMIGGAAYTYPTYFYGLEKNKEKTMDVVEIDEVMTKLAVENFNLDLSNEKLNVIHQDGRSYINYTDEKYDAILVDAFKGMYAPYELTTLEAAQRMYDILNENGLVITNVISSLEGKDAKFMKHEYATYKEVFDDVKVFTVNYHGDEHKEKEQNIILLGIKGKLDINHSVEDEYTKLLDTEVFGYESDYDIVTDNLAQIGD